MNETIPMSWYAIKLNEKYWLGHHAMDPSGASGVLGPSMCGAFLIPTNSSKKMITNFRNLAREHGGQLVKLNLDISETIDEMLKSKFEKITEAPPEYELEKMEDEEESDEEE